jgi:hypothetical protein
VRAVGEVEHPEQRHLVDARVGSTHRGVETARAETRLAHGVAVEVGAIALQHVDDVDEQAE